MQTVHHTDSLRQVVAARTRQATAARVAASSYRRAADSLQLSLGSYQGEVRRLQDGLATTNVLLVSQAAKTAKYKARAHRKGWLNAVLLAVAAGLTYSLITK